MNSARGVSPYGYHV